MPAVVKGIAIARALDVPVQWLFDDAQDWPPPEPGNERPHFSDAELAREAGRRLDSLLQELAASTKALHQALQAWHGAGLKGKRPEALQDAAVRVMTTSGLITGWIKNVKRKLIFHVPPRLLLTALKCLPDQYLQPDKPYDPEMDFEVVPAPDPIAPVDDPDLMLTREEIEKTLAGGAEVRFYKQA